MRKQHIVTLRHYYWESGNPELKVTTWFCGSRDVALARITALFVLHPAAEIQETGPFESLDQNGVTRSETTFTLELNDRADEPQPPKCQRCGVTLIVGPTAMDHERFGKRLCGGC